MDNFYDELIDFLCPNTRETWRPPLLPKYIQYHGRGEWKSSYPRFNVTYTVKLNPEFFKPKQIKQPQMKQQKFNNGTMIAVITPRGTTVAILAEDFTYEKPCMVAVKTMLTYDGILTISDSVGQGQLYIHQDCLDVRLSSEQEGLRLFSAIKASGAEVPKVEKGGLKEFAPSDGDFVLVDNNVFGIYNRVGKPLHVALLDGKLMLNYTFGSSKRHLAPSERQLLLGALTADGKTWNATEKRVEKVLWRAKEGETYFAAYFSDDKTLRVPTKIEESFDSMDDVNYATGDYFQHESDCQLLCDQLNAVVKANKEERIKLN